MTGGQIGRYQLREEIGRGGMATVRRAFDPNSKREVAIKLLPPEMLYSSDFRKRFRKELETISSLEHAHIVPVYDSGEENGQPYFVMRYMTGGSLAAKLKKGRLSLMETAEIIEKLARGLTHAHQKGVIHRDLKPENILFDEEGNPYLSDFGVAKLIEDASSETGSRLAGTPDYASPEQVQGENEKVDHRTDVYGLGVLVYRMLTGRLPYRAKTPANVLYKQITQPVPNILAARPDLPPALEMIIKTAMAKRREDRYHSVLEFAHSLAVAAFGPERTVPRELVLERRRLVASGRMRKVLGTVGVLLVLILAAAYFSHTYLAPAPASTNTPSATPSSAFTPTPAPSETPVPAITPTSEPTPIPTPPGGAIQVALVDFRTGYQVMSMRMDEFAPRTVVSTLPEGNFRISNPQWIHDGSIIFVGPDKNCVYQVFPGTKKLEKMLCIKKTRVDGTDEILQDFRVSPDGRWAAIVVTNVLIVVPYHPEKWENAGWAEENFTTPDHLKSGNCWYFNSMRKVQWALSGTQIAALGTDTSQGMDQIKLFDLDLTNCNGSGESLSGHVSFPAWEDAGRKTIPDFEWDGRNLFLLNDVVRNNSYGNLYLYDSESDKLVKVEPVGECCYRDARWSPDGNYIMFVYRDQADLAGTYQLFYISLAGLDGDATSDPILTFTSSLILELQPAFMPPN